MRNYGSSNTNQAVGVVQTILTGVAVSRGFGKSAALVSDARIHQAEKVCLLMEYLGRNTAYLVKVYVRSGDIEPLHDSGVESRYALLPSAHYASAVTKTRMLCDGRLMWSLDGSGNVLGRNKVWRSHSVGTVRQDVPRLRELFDLLSKAEHTDTDH